MVDMVPTRGYRNPAPTDARTSRMGRVNPATKIMLTHFKTSCEYMCHNEPVGAPLIAGSEVKER